MVSHNEPRTYLHGRLSLITRAVWLLLVGIMLALFMFGIPFRLKDLMGLTNDAQLVKIIGIPSNLIVVATSSLSRAELEALQTLGISQEFYAGYILSFDIALVVVSTLIGFLIFWRRPRDWLALWISFILIGLGTNGASMVVYSLIFVWPGWILSTIIYGFIGMVSNVHLLFISPDGQYVPRWTKPIAVGFTGFMVIFAISIPTVYQKWGIPTTLLIALGVGLIWFALSGLGILTQIYRYLRVSDMVQRQQSRWVAVGLIAVTLGFGLNGIFIYASAINSGLPRLLFNMLRAPLVNLFLAFLPVCLAISILRYRLWDIDVIIRKTLVYSILTGLLGIMYYSGVILLQSILNGRRNGPGIASNPPSPVVIVVTTLIIVALFNPLRTRIQDFIDRRFYRRKYDAEKALAAFAAAARSETDLKALSGDLLRLVQETMQPQQVSLWLKKGDE